jgi:hypothetical protein
LARFPGIDVLIPEGEPLLEPHNWSDVFERMARALSTLVVDRGIA